MKLRSAAIGVIALLVPPAASAQQARQDSAAGFVRDFYAWFDTAVIRAQDGIALVLRSRRQALSPQLARALEAEQRAAARADDDWVGLDFDPFTNSQEPPCGQHVVRRTRPAGAIVVVEVHQVCVGWESPGPAAVAHVAQVQGRWVFTDFDLGEGTTLLGSLRRWSQERARRPGVP